MADQTLVRTFQFHVSLTSTVSAGAQNAFADGAFQECSGLSIDMDVQDYFEGGRNNAVVRRVGRAKYTPLVLKRGMFYAEGSTADSAFWKWLQDIVNGTVPVRRYDGLVQVQAP